MAGGGGCCEVGQVGYTTRQETTRRPLGCNTGSRFRRDYGGVGRVGITRGEPPRRGWVVWTVGNRIDGEKVVLGRMGPFPLSDLMIPSRTMLLYLDKECSCRSGHPQTLNCGSYSKHPGTRCLPFCGSEIFKGFGMVCWFFCSQQVGERREEITVGGFYRPVPEMA